MARIVFAWELGANYGHISSFAPIAAELRRRGHEVIPILQQLHDAPRFFDRDVPLLQAPHPKIPLTRPANPALHHTYTDLLRNFGYSDAYELTTLLRGWRSVLDLTAPDLVIYESAPTALLASRGRTFRKVAFGSGYSIPPRVSPLPALLPELRLPFTELELKERAVLAVINAALANLGTERLAAMKDIFELDAVLIKSVPELDQYAARSDVEYVGPAYSVDAGAEVDWPAGDAPRVFMYLRPTPDRLKQLVQQLARAPLRIIAVIPSASADILKQLQAPNVFASDKPVRLRNLVQTADLAVCHSAVGTGAAFLFAGVPLLLLPTNTEQKMSALRVAEWGAGLIAGEPQPSYPQYIVRLLKQPEFRASARKLAAKYGGQPEQAPGTVCDRLERLLST